MAFLQAYTEPRTSMGYRLVGIAAGHKNFFQDAKESMEQDLFLEMARILRVVFAFVRNVQ